MASVYYPQARAILEIVFDGFSGEGSESDPKIIPVIPKQATVHRNSYRQADSWELVFEGGDFPIDPALVRAGAAEIFLFQTMGLGKDRQIDRQRPPGLKISGDGGDVANNTRFALGNKPMVAGLFDDMGLELSGGGRWVTISGQDYTALLAAKQWPPTPGGVARRIPVGTRLDVWLGDILSEADPKRRLQVLVELDSRDLPFVGRDEVAGNARGIPIESGTSYWDVIYKTVTRYGFIVFVRGLDVVISRPKNLDDVTAKDVKRMGWGRNLETLRMTRHLGKEKVPQIIVRGYDPNNRKVITAEFPSNALKRVAKDFRPSYAGRAVKQEKITTQAKKKAVTPKEALKIENEFVIVPAFGISDHVVLRRMAENLHAILGRAERKVVASTRDLDDLEGSSMMDLASGDAVEIEWQDFDAGILNELSEGARREALIERGFSQPVAQTIAQHYTKLLGIKRPFKVREVTYEYSTDDGIRIEFELVDFVKVDGVDTADQQTSRKNKRKDRIKNPDGTPKGAGAVLTKGFE